MINISKDESIYVLIKQHPNIKDVMLELGFKDIVKKGMLGTVGRIMTIEKGSQMKKIPMEEIKKIFNKHGYTIT
jgi:hypothetical protein